MKWQSIIVLLALAIAILAPPSFAPTASHHGQPTLSSLDVCHSASPAIAAGGEMPGLAVHSQAQAPAPYIAYLDELKPLFTAFLIISGNERPPAA